MKKISVQQKKNLVVSAIRIGQLILDHSHYVSCWGYIKVADAWVSVDMVTNYDVLNTMLRQIDDQAAAVQMAIVYKLEQLDQEPQILDFEKEIGSTILFDQLQFELVEPLWEGPYGAHQSNIPCYYIQKAIAKVDQPVQVATPKRKSLKWIRLYELYLGYLELDFDEESARKYADLEEDRYFSRAYRAWNQYRA
jgi:hypothetical protein